ncbi:CheW domain protein [Vibrio variabilis]|uniref:CheW domain protein n=1 Tax=Vibrio variabilis TaxID=990271 RepID=A0ABQ0JHK8_9VIBR|nr:CheW domain protein [Vibrio variabilis]
MQQQVDIEVDTEIEVKVEAQPEIVGPEVEVPVEEEIQSWDVTSIEPELPVSETETAAESFEPVQISMDAQELEQAADSIEATASYLDRSNGGGAEVVWQNGERTEGFQVLYFDVNGMTFAVPLDELGGIHQIAELSHLIGRPAWYLGLQSSRENKLDVVDTAMWVMSDVLQDDSHKEDYQYIVMLGESNWGLAATELKGTEQLAPEAVRWREKAGKRPWLAGMVKQQMCALVHVSELIDMLNAGLDVKSVQ